MKSLAVGFLAFAFAIVAPITGTPADAVQTPVEHIMPIEAPTPEIESGCATFDVASMYESMV